MTYDPAAQAADPRTSHAELYELARTRPDLRDTIAANPNTYPALLDWLRGLHDPAIDAALARRGSTEEFGAVQSSTPRDEPTAVHQPVASRGGFDQQVFGAPAHYAASHQHQPPLSVYDPEEDEVAPPRRKGGACVLIFLLLLVTLAALAVAYYVLAGNPFTDGDQGDDDQTAPAEDAGTEDEDAEEDNDAEQTELESPAPEDALSITDFSSPTGNINCQLTEEAVTCTVLEYDFDAPAECGDGVTFRVEDEAEAQIDCSLGVGSQGEALEYGEVTGNESFACQAHELYFECWSQRTGNGFEIAREYYAL